ncbi:hypothetical protein SteCoe_15938 [Stentor coeruleus]|uniref:C3H1-type domain-containing protein n=1 Tax=Stentor coeruleus TaxID=5963 RepID=A0A1R2C2N7_9CILI|nr:hypothetical protein SteCoe_15938 [Stentor coeruleus]
MSSKCSMLIETQPLDMWSWEVISSEFQQKMNLNLDEKPKELENPIIKNYLVNPCKVCSEDPCLNYHPGQKPRREILYLGGSRWSYSYKKCLRKKCENPKCPDAHSLEEILYHPKYYKTLKCNYILKDSICERFGKLCPYIHDLEKPQDRQVNPLKINQFDLATFKTTPCPIRKIHNRKICFYYHRPIEKRRNPIKYAYTTEACRKHVCTNLEMCNKCHTNNEYIYHPSVFRKNPCRLNEKCLVKEICPFYHIDRHDRVLDQCGEIEQLINRCEESSKQFSELRNKNSLFQKFLCSMCFGNKSQYILKCGHTKCNECQVSTLCSLCQKPAIPLIKILF